MGSKEHEIRVLIAFSGEEDGKDGHIIHLRHPNTGTKTCYLYAGGNLLELQWYKPGLASWFIGNSICEDGSIYLATPVDPVFMLLPILEKASMKKDGSSGKFRDVEEILCVEGFPAYSALCSYFKAHISLICQTKDVGGMTFCRLDDCRTLSWLVCKVRRGVTTMREMGGEAFATLGADELEIYTVGLLSEYLPIDWLQKLCSYLGIDLSAVKRTKQTTGIVSQPLPAAMPHGNISIKIASSHPSGKSGKAAQKKNGLQPGVRKITSFFAQPR